MKGLVNQSAKKLTGDQVALSSSVVGTMLKLVPPKGAYDGANTKVTIDDADFGPESVVIGKNVFGLDGTNSAIKSIQRGTVTVNNGGSNPYTLNIAISSVDQAKSIVRITMMGCTSTTYDTAQRSAVKMYLTSATNLRLYLVAATTSGGNTPSVSWEVIEFNNVKSLQSGEYSLTATTGTTTITSVDVNKSMLFFSHDSQSTSDLIPYINIMGRISAATQLYFEQPFADTKAVRWYVVEFN